MRTAASWFRSPWDLPNTRTWRATFAATPEQARLDRLAFGLLLAKRPLVNPDGARAYRRARARRGVGLLEMICVLNDLSDRKERGVCLAFVLDIEVPIQGERQRMSRTQRRIRHVTEAASLRIGAGMDCQVPNTDDVRPPIRARCEKDARRDLCGGRGATRVSTATASLRLYVRLDGAYHQWRRIPPR